MKWISLFAVSIVLTTQASLCSDAPLTAPQSQIRVTDWPKNLRSDLRGTSIRIALPENAPDRQWDDALIAKFEDLTGIHVEIVRPGNDTTEVLTAYLKEFAAGAPKADVYAIDIVWPGILADYAEDLKPSFGELPDVLPVLVQNDTVKGKLVAIPYFIEISLLYYRSDLLRKYKFVRPPTTWDELEHQARIIQKGERATASDGFWGYLWQGASSEALTCNALEWQVSQGAGDLLDQDGNIDVNRERLAAVLDRAQAWIGDISPSNTTSQLEDDSLQTWKNGKAAFMRNWPYAFVESMKSDSQVRNQVGVTALPSGNPPRGRHADTLGGFQLMVSKESANKSAAIELVKFLTSPEIQRFNAIHRGYPPARLNLYDESAMVGASPLLETLKDIVLNSAIVRPSAAAGPQYDAISRTYFTAVQQVLKGQRPSKNVVGSLETDLRVLLSPPSHSQQ